MKTQMRNGIEHVENGPKVVGKDVIPHLARHEIELNGGHILMQLNKERSINFPSTQNFTGFTWHAPGMIFAHPLQIMRIVSASFKLASVPRPKTFALRAKHLIASLGLVNGNLAIGAGFCVSLKKGDGSDRIRIAHMVIGLEFPAMRTSVLVTCGTLPSGRDEAVAIGISTAMDELIGGGNVVGRVMLLQLTFCLNEINFDGIEGLYLCIDIPDLIVNILDELVMNDGSLCGRKHGLFLGEQNVLLMLGEFASEEGLCKTEVLKL